jgi:16S rRNA (guanine966-N2)-methyltransferase
MRNRRPPPAGVRRTPPGTVRIIGGTFRGRRLPLVANPGLRPTPDRVRETLFNWLQPMVNGARVLDLYAGSGALGLEALSRGAAEAWFVEQDGPSAVAIEGALATLGARGRVVRGDVGRVLKTAPPALFDLVFIDPPFATGPADNLCKLLAAGWLAPAAWVYIELPRADRLPDWPGFGQHREATAGDVRYGLLRRTAGAAPADPPTTTPPGDR